MVVGEEVFVLVPPFLERVSRRFNLMVLPELHVQPIKLVWQRWMFYNSKGNFVFRLKFLFNKLPPFPTKLHYVKILHGFLINLFILDDHLHYLKAQNQIFHSALVSSTFPSAIR